MLGYKINLLLCDHKRIGNLEYVSCCLLHILIEIVQGEVVIY